MRNSVPTLGEMETPSGAMLQRVVAFAIGQGAPDHAPPGTRDGAHGLRPVAACVDDASAIAAFDCTMITVSTDVRELA